MKKEVLRDGALSMARAGTRQAVRALQAAALGAVLLTVGCVNEAACGPGTIESGGVCVVSPSDGGHEADAGTGAMTQDCSGIGPASPPTVACCLAYGVDACGVGLVCARLDDRTVPVCYFEGTRGSGEECTSDRLCASGICNGSCAKGVGDECTRSEECGYQGGDPTESRLVCASAWGFRDDAPVCRIRSGFLRLVDSGVASEACLSDGDCAEGLVDGRTRCPPPPAVLPDGGVPPSSQRYCE